MLRDCYPVTLYTELRVMQRAVADILNFPWPSHPGKSSSASDYQSETQNKTLSHL